MKRFLIILLTSIFLVAFCSCSNQNAETSSSTSEFDSQSLSSETNNSDFVEITSGKQETDSTDKLQTFTKDFDGIVLTVTTDKSTYYLGESINVTATLENNSDNAIYLFYGASTANGSAELMTYFEQLIEFPIYGDIWRNDVLTVIPFEQGEKCIQDFTFQTYTDYFQGSSGNGYVTLPTEFLPDFNKPAELGVHNGKLCVQTCSDVNYPYGDIIDYSLDFSITLK